MKVLLSLFLFYLPLMAPESVAQADSVSEIDKDADDVASFIRSIEQSSPADKATTLKSVPEAILHLSQFPGQRQTIVRSQEDAAILCNGYFQGWFFWWGCKDDILQKVFPQIVLEKSVEISRTEHYSLVYDILMQSANHYIDEEAFKTMMNFVSIQYMGLLVTLIRDSNFEPTLVPLCNSRASSIGNTLSPIASARRLNQANILRCIASIRNKRMNIRNRPSVFLCRAKIDIVSRTACLQEALKDK